MNEIKERFIVLLERFLQTDVRYLAKGTFWLSTGRIIGGLIAFFLSIFYARYLPKELYGDYRYVVSVLGALGIFALPGVATTIMRSVTRGFEGTFRDGSRLIFLSSFLISFMSAGIAVWFYLKGNTHLGAAFLIAAFLIPLAEGTGNWRAYYDGKKEFQRKTRFNIASNLFFGLLMTGAVVTTFTFTLPPFFTLALLITSYFLGHAIPNTIAYLSTLRMVEENAPSEKGALRYGLHLSLLEAPSTVANYLDGILLYQLLGPESLAIYSFALAPPEQIKGFLSASAVVAFPKLSLRTHTFAENEELLRTLPKKIFRSIWITLTLVVCYVLIAPFFFSIFFPAYQEAVPFSQAFALPLIFFPFSIFGSALKAEGNLKKIYGYQLISPIIQIGALVLLVPLFGLWGAITARILGRFFTFGLGYIFFVWR